jgi:tetratricopeptide (TPR) repeat protein
MIGRLCRAERLFCRAQKLVIQDRLHEALDAFQQALALQPRAAGIYLHWALALAEADRLLEAHEAMQQAIALQPANPVLPMFLGQIFFDHAEYDTAQAWCERALTLNPHNSHAIALQALTYLALGDIPRGYQGLMQPLPLPPIGIEQGLLRFGKPHLPSVLQQSNAALQSRLLLLVETYLLQHGVAARTLFQQLTATGNEPGTPRQAHTIMVAIDRLCTRALMGAKRMYVGVRYAMHPTTRAHRLLQSAAEEAYYLGDSPTALSSYTHLLQQIPECSKLRQPLFEIYYELGDARRALKHLQRLLGPENEPDAWQSLCLGELFYQVEQFPQTVAYLDRAAALRLHDYKLFYYLGLCHLHNGNAGAARRQFVRAVQTLNPDLSFLRLDEMWRVYQHLSAQPSPHQ